MKSRTPLNPLSDIPRYKPVPKRRAKPRRGPMRDPKYRAYLRSQCCYVCWRLGRPSACGEPDQEWREIEQRVTRKHQNFPTEPAHTKNNGTSSKGPDSSCAPLCMLHHEEYDAGRKRFEKKYGVNMREIAAQYYTRYLEESAVLRRTGVAARRG